MMLNNSALPTTGATAPGTATQARPSKTTTNPRRNPVQPRYPRIPLKDMDGTMLVFELGREIDRVVGSVDHREMIASATSIASYLHRKQTRKTRQNMPSTPYIEHPLRVTLRLIRWGSCDAQLLTSGLLHDTVEDCAKEINSQFANEDDHLNAHTPTQIALGWMGRCYDTEVVTIVAGMTNGEGPSFDYTGHLSDIEDVRVLLGKASDLTDNAGSLIHQYGHVKDAFIIPKVIKYTPGVDIVRAKLLHQATLSQHTGIKSVLKNAALALEKVARNLTTLREKLNIS